MIQYEKIGSHKTTVTPSSDGISKTRVTYHDTDVVTFNHAEVTLNTGGYFTSTTKKRMNQSSDEFSLGFAVFQKNFEFFVRIQNGDVIPFEGNKITFANR